EDLAFGETELLHGVVIGGGATGENYGGSGRGGDEERFHCSLDLEISGRCREVGGDRREGEGNASEISRVWRGIGGARRGCGMREDGVGDASRGWRALRLRWVRRRKWVKDTHGD